jgi:uncharacterized protein
MKASSAEPAVALRVRIAVGLLARARGLLWRPSPPPGGGLLLAGVRMVHGFGLRHPLDLVYLDGEGRVLACAVLAPWRISRCFAACHVLELRRGECERSGLVPGRRLQVTIVEDIFGGPQPEGRQGEPPSSPGVRQRLIAASAIALALAALPCLPLYAAPGAGDATGLPPASGPAAADATTVDHHVGEPRRKRVRKARGSLHRDAADGTPAKLLRKARPRRPKGSQGAVEYLVGEPGRFDTRPRGQAAQAQRGDKPGGPDEQDRRR